MQVTGETLERAMAVLEGHTTAPTSQSEPDANPDVAGNNDLDNGEDDESGAAGESNEDTEKASQPDARRTPQKRGHLRGL